VATLPHPHLVPVYEVGQVGPACYIASQYCSGPTLAAWLRQQRAPIDPRVAAEIVQVIADTVAYVHRHGILHRDLKPANVLIDCELNPPSESLDPLDSPADSLKLTDFGLAKLDCGTSGHTCSGLLIGTPAYMAPEQATSRLSEIGPETDVYAMGVMLYELLTGTTPFQGRTDIETLWQVNEAILAPPRKVRPDIPRDLEAICLKCLEKRPQDRYASAVLLAEDLNRYLDKRPVTARPIGWVSRLGRRVRRRPAIWGLAATLLFSLIAGAGIAGLNAYRLKVQREATDLAFMAAYNRCNDLITIVREGVETSAGTLPLSGSRRAQIALECTSFLDRYADEVPIRPDVVYGYSRLAAYYLEIGDQRQFELFADKSAACGRRLIREAEEYPNSRQHVPQVHYRLAMLEAYRGNETAAIEGYRGTAVSARELLNSGASILTKDVHRCLANSHYHAATMLRYSDPSSAVAEYDLACREFRAMLRQWPDDADFQLRLSGCLLSMGRCLLRLDRTDQALPLLHETKRIIEDSNPDNIHDQCTAQWLLAEACREIGRIYGKHDADQSQEWDERVVEALEKSVAAKPELASHRRRLANFQCKIGRHHSRNGNFADAIAVFLRAIDHYNWLLADDPTNAGAHRRIENARRRVSNMQSALALRGD
jgi:tetratricopeptide (TPR) repeat protein